MAWRRARRCGAVAAVIIFIYGTTGELIKIAPLIRRIADRGLPLLAISTNQQAQQIEPMCDDLQIPRPDIVLTRGYRGLDLSRNWHVVPWFARLVVNFALQRRRLLRIIGASPGRPLVMVHGDTLTTVIGALMGKVLRVDVGHLEAGLRSHDWRHPFPEELNRRAVGRVADVHYAPGAVAAAHLSHAPGEVLDIGANTVVDSIAMVPEGLVIPPDVVADPLPERRFGIVSIHRFELLAHADRLQEILSLLSREAKRTPMYFIDHPVTAARINQLGLGSLFDSETFIRVPRLGYLHFIALLRRCAFLVTDSGGAQEECFHLDKPCLVHRMETERGEGLGANVVLSRFSMAVVQDFLDQPDRWQVGKRPDVGSPSDRVLEHLLARGVWGAT